MHLLIRLALSTLLTIPLTACDNFTLIGRVDLGGGDALPAPPTGEADPAAAGPPPASETPASSACWPSSKAAIAEMKGHGYAVGAWPATAAWLRALQPLDSSLPLCEGKP